MRNFLQLSILRSFTYWKLASNNSKYVFCRRVLLSNHSKVHREFWVTGSAGVPSHGFCSHPTSPTAGVGGSKSKSELQRGPIPTRSILPLKTSSGELTWATEFRWDHSFPAENSSNYKWSKNQLMSSMLTIVSWGLQRTAFSLQIASEWKQEFVFLSQIMFGPQ